MRTGQLFTVEFNGHSGLFSTSPPLAVRTELASNPPPPTACTSAVRSAGAGAIAGAARTDAPPKKRAPPPRSAAPVQQPTQPPVGALTGVGAHPAAAADVEAALEGKGTLVVVTMMDGDGDGDDGGPATSESTLAVEWAARQQGPVCCCIGGLATLLLNACSLCMTPQQPQPRPQPRPRVPVGGYDAGADATSKLVPGSEVQL